MKDAENKIPDSVFLGIFCDDSQPVFDAIPPMLVAVFLESGAFLYACSQNELWEAFNFIEANAPLQLVKPGKLAAMGEAQHGFEKAGATPLTSFPRLKELCAKFEKLPLLTDDPPDPPVCNFFRLKPSPALDC